MFASSLIVDVDVDVFTLILLSRTFQAPSCICHSVTTGGQELFVNHQKVQSV